LQEGRETAPGRTSRHRFGAGFPSSTAAPGGVQPQGAAILHIFLSDRPKFVPNEEHECHSDPDAGADGEEPSIGGKCDEQNHHHPDRNDQPCRAAQRQSG